MAGNNNNNNNMAGNNNNNNNMAGMLKCVLGWCLPITYQKLESPSQDGPVGFLSFDKIVTIQYTCDDNYQIIIFDDHF